MSKKYLAHENTSPSLGLMPALWTVTALKVFGAPEWLWGVVAVAYLLVFIGALYRIFTYEKVEL